MTEKKSRSWIWAATLLVAIQIFVLVGLWQLRQGESHSSSSWDLDPQAAQREAAEERESREALSNLPVPKGTVRLTVSAAQAAAPQAEDLLEQAKDLQNRGQFDLAEKVIAQAQAKDTANPRIRIAAGRVAGGPEGEREGGRPPAPAGPARIPRAGACAPPTAPAAPSPRLRNRRGWRPS